jgi:hypothetical protein
MRKLQTGLIQPASSLVVNAGVNKMHSLMQEHNQRVRAERLASGGRKLIIAQGGGVAMAEHVAINNPASESKLANKEDAKKAANLNNVVQQLAEEYPNLPAFERKALANEILKREEYWGKNPTQRPPILFADGGGISTDGVSNSIPSVRTQAMRSVINEYSHHLDQEQIESIRENITGAKKAVKQFLVKGDEYIDKGLEFAGKKFNQFQEEYPKTTLALQGIGAMNSYISHEFASNSIIRPIEEKLGELNRQYIIDPALSYLDLNPGKPGHRFGSMVIGGLEAVATGKAISSFSSMPPKFSVKSSINALDLAEGKGYW